MTTTSNWMSWLQEWLSRHPLKEPPAELQRRYLQEVMAKIHAAETPARAVDWQPRRVPVWRLALGGTMATALALSIVMALYPRYLTHQIEQEAQVLFEAVGVAALNDADLEQEVETQDRIVLAEAVEDETLRLWEELEDAGAGPADEESGSDEELIKELQHLDEEELALS